MSLGGSTAFKGYNAWLGINEETTFGTQVTVASYSEFYTESMKQNREPLVLESINTSRDSIRFLQGNETVEGTLEMDLNVAEDSVVYLIKQAMGGTCASASNSTDEIMHTLYTGNMEDNQSTSGAAATKSLSISIQKGDTTTAQWHFSGNRVNTLNITGEVGTPIKLSADIIGRTATNTTESHTIAFSDITPLHFTGISINTGDSITNLSATSCIGFEFSLNNNLVNDSNSRELGSRLLKILPPTNREVTLKLTMRFDTNTAYNNFLAATPIAVKLLFDSSQTIGSTAGNSTYSMFINLPTCYTQNNPMPEIGDKGVIPSELEFICLKENTTTGYSVQMQIDNATANY